jgi:hypothetical protein
MKESRDESKKTSLCTQKLHSLAAALLSAQTLPKTNIYTANKQHIVEKKE